MSTSIGFEMMDEGFVPKAGFSSQVVCSGRIEDAMLAQIAGSILHVGYADLTFENDIALGRIPESPIIKMTSKRWADRFFETGSLLLGTYEGFRKAENEEVRDETEGNFLIASRNRKGTVFLEGQGGFEHYAFCTFIGEPDPDVIAQFGYDSCYRIDKPADFHRVIGQEIGAKDGAGAQCVYRNDKVLVAPRPYAERWQVLSARSAKLAGTAKFFIKPRHFQHQQEYRFTWRLERDDLVPQAFDVPEAVQYCTRVF